MLQEVYLENFRGFKFFKLTNLGQLNLLVGSNNSGKTTILEAIQMLCSRADLESSFEALERRGEFFLNNENSEDIEYDVRHLFYGHDIDLINQFAIYGTYKNSAERLEVSINKEINSDLLKKEIIDRLGPVLANTKYNNEDLLSYIENLDSTELRSMFNNEQILSLIGFSSVRLNVQWMEKAASKSREITLPLSDLGSIPLAKFQKYIKAQTKENLIKTNFVTSSSLTSKKMTELFDQVVLTPEEMVINEALRTIEPNINRIATLGTERHRKSESRSGFVVRLSNSNQRVPIGSFGDGIWRMLGLALATTSTSNGVLFIDEIDTGLHFSAMTKMWQLIWETAKKLNVQIFATTHNSDCWTSLASLVNSEGTSQNSISIHRIEKGKSSSIVFSDAEIMVAAERGIEVR